MDQGRARTLLAGSAVALLFAAAPAGAQQEQEKDFLDAGIVFRGSVTFERKEEFAEFVLHVSDDSRVFVRALRKPWPSAPPSTSVYARWSERLARAQIAAV